MKKKFAFFMLILLLVGIFVMNLEIAPVVLVGKGDASNRKEVWQLVNVTNPGPTNKSTNIEVTVNPSKEGVNIACSTNITKYFESPDPGYTDWFDWLNGTTKSPYHWGEMDWYVSAGSLTDITYNEIQQWWDMYSDSGAGVTYKTFMGNTYMADWNSAVTYNDPDIIYPAIAWQGNKFVVEHLPVLSETTINIAFKIVITKPGAYTFNFASTTTGLTISPSSFTVGGASTLVVPHDYSTIQGAINVAGPGDIIIVDEGIHNEAIIINKKLTIIGAGAATTTITGVGKVAGTPVVTIDATGNVSFSGFTITGAPPNVAGDSFGMLAKQTTPTAGVTYTISDCKFVGTNNPAANGEFQFYASGGQEAIVFTRNVITQYSGNAIVSEIHTGSTEISYNSFDAPLCNVDPADTIFFMTYGGKDVTTLQNIAHNTFNMSTANLKSTAVSICAPGPGSAQGNAKFTNIVITENTFNSLKNNGRAIGFWNGYVGYPAPPAAQDNIISPVVTNNHIYGVPGSVGSFGISFYDDFGSTTGATIRCNTITGMAVGIYLRAGDAPGTIIDCNNIYNNTIGVDWHLGSTAVDATNNWWGDPTGPQHSSNPGGNGDIVTNNVDYGPWLVKPYAPGQVVPVSVVYVDPPYIIRNGPAIGTTFTVKVNVANVSMLYAFQFDLKWNSSLLSLANWSNYSIPNWTNKRVMKNNSTAPGVYSLAVTALPPSLPFSGSTTLASFTFEIIYDPVYPKNVSCSLALENVTIANSDAEPIVHLTYDGNYSCYSTKTKLVSVPQDFMVYKVPTEFDVYVNVINVADLYAFEFELTYNTTLLEVVVDKGVDVIIPCYSENITLSSGRVFVRVKDIYPSARNGTLTLVKIPFKVKGFVWNTTKTSANCTLAFTSHELNSTTLEKIQHDVVNGTYRYTPIPGDLNMDGKVDIFDIILAARAFGSEPPSDPRADLNCDGKVDILDIVLIAVNFGRDEP